MRTRSASLRWLCVVAPLLLALAGIGGGSAAAQRVAAPLDLAAMTLRPPDLDGGYGLAGGYVLTVEEVARTTNNVREGTEQDFDALVDTLTEAGWRRRYTSILRAPESDDPDVSGTSVSSYVTEYRDAAGAAAGFAELEAETVIEFEGTEYQADHPGTRTIGDRSEITLVARGVLDLTFQLGNLVGGVSSNAFIGRESEVEEIEALADILLARMEGVRDGPRDVGVSTQILRLTGGHIRPQDDQYQRLSGETFRNFGEADADLEARDRQHADWGDTDVFRVSQLIWAEDAGPDGYATFAVTLHRFASEEEARIWIAEVPAAFIANPGSFQDVVAIPDVADVGDEAAGVEYQFARPSGVTVTGYSIYIRVHDLIAIVQADAQSAPPLTLVEELAAAQADCMTDGACLDHVSVPGDLRVAAGGAPDRPAPMNQADKLRDLLDDLD